MVNGTPGSGVAVTIPSFSDLGPDQMSLPFLEGQPTVSGDDASVLIPEGARGGEGVGSEQMMAFVAGQPTYADRAYEGEGPGAFVPGSDWVPNYTYSPGEAYFPGLSAVAGWKTDESERDDQGTDDNPVQSVFMPNIHAWPKEYDIESLPEGAERVESGSSIDTQGTVFAGPSDLLFPEDAFDERQFPDDAFDQGVALPLNGEPLGLGVLATPTASVGGEEANPLVDMDTAQFLRREATRSTLSDSGLSDADRPEWLGGPTPFPEPGVYDGSIDLLGTSTDLETFGGVLSGEDGPWAAVLFVARVTDGDHVVAVAGVTRPVSTADGGMALVEGSGWGMDRGLELLPRAAEFAAETIGQLERA
jgi:hypothetical protein